MDNSQTRIDELKNEIDDNNIDLKQIFQSAGEKMITPGVFSGENERISGFLTKLTSLDTRISEIDAQIDDLRHSFNRIAEITDREKDIGEQYSLLEKENRKLFLPIGKAAFIEWKERPSEDQRKLMSGLEELESIIDGFENEIFNLENNEVKKSIVNKIKEKGRVAIVKSKKKSRELSLNNLYKKTGEKLYKKDLSFFEKMNNDSVSSFIANKKEQEKLDSEVQELKQENSRLEKHLKNAFSSSKMQKAEEKLLSERDFILSEKMAKLNDLGSYLYDEKLDFDDEEIKSLFSSADDVNGRISLLNNEIEKCKAELEIVQLDEEVADMKENIKELQLTIEKCTGDIGEFNKEIKRAKAQIRKLKKLTETDPRESEDQGA